MLYHFTIRYQGRCPSPDLLRTEHEAARLVDGPRVERRSQALGDGKALR